MESFNGGGGGGRRESTSTAGSSSSPSFSAAYGTTTATAVRAPARISVAVVSSGPSEAVQVFRRLFLSNIPFLDNYCDYFFRFVGR